MKSVPRSAEASDQPFEQWPADVSFGQLATLIGYALRRAQIAIYRDFFASVGGLTPPLFAALTLIDANAGLNQTQLGRVMGINRAAVMALVNRLADRGCVARAAVPGDKRANALRLTAAGRRQLAKASRAVVAHDARISRNLSATELRTLRKLLAKF